MSGDQPIRTQVGGHPLTLSNPSKVLYPATGFTKAEVLEYFGHIAPVLLPHVRGRPMSFKRFPDGVDASGFFAKNAPRGTPPWVRTVTLPSPGSTKNRDTIDYVLLDSAAALLWAGNLAALELHVPQWKVGPRDGVHDADLLVLDLDPGEPASIVECGHVALRLRELLTADGLLPLAKTSGSKGMQLYAAVQETPSERTSGYARSLGRRLAHEDPTLVVDTMERARRPGRVYVDWSQNNAAKTTIAPYSLRARSHPTVSTPVTWDEVTACVDSGDPAMLRFEAAQVLERVERHGDLFAPLLKGTTRSLPAGTNQP